LQQHPALGMRVAGGAISHAICKAERRRRLTRPCEFPLGFFNLVAGMTLVSNCPVAVAFSASFVALIVGAMAMGIYLSLHFGKVRREKERDDRKSAITT
jgi:membrane associated rhomboid family serine protease